MKRRLVGSFCLIGLLILAAAAVLGQDKTVRSIAGDKWVITAEAGGVNHVEGGVNVARLAGKTGRLLKGDSVDVGDRVITESNGRAEILLNPGSYVRVAGDSEFEFKRTALEDLQLKLTRGSAILEVFATNDFRVQVEASKAKIDLIESGVYRVDVLSDGTGRLEVWKGKAEVAGTIVKSGRVVTSGGGSATVAKFDRDEKDEFELWSRSRAKDLAKSNSALKNRDMRTALMRSFLGGRWNTYNSFGLWVYSAQFGRYCFLPFGWGWSSPYGYGFGADIWWYGLPSVIFRPPSAGPSSGPATSPGPGTGGPTGPAPAPSVPTDGNSPRGRTPANRRPPIDEAISDGRARPPFEEVQGRPMMGRRSIGDDGSGVNGGSVLGPSPQRDSGVSPVSIPTMVPPSAGPSSSERSSGASPVRRGRDPID